LSAAIEPLGAMRAESDVASRINSMTNNDPYTYYTTSDGRAWTTKMPESVQRDLALCRAIDLLALGLEAARTTTKAAQKAVETTSADAGKAELFAVRSEQILALSATIAELVKLSEATIDAAQRALFLK